jgi:hypothetical protein
MATSATLSDRGIFNGILQWVFSMWYFGAAVSATPLRFKDRVFAVWPLRLTLSDRSIFNGILQWVFSMWYFGAAVSATLNDRI